MTLRCLDSITPANLPPGADAYLAYANGRWPTAAAVRTRFPAARVIVLAVSPGDPDADGCDCETGDLTPQQVPADVRMRQARGVWRPVVYVGADGANDVLDDLRAAGIGREQIRLLTAHYGKGKHICGPATCGYRDSGKRIVPAADGTQWRDNAPGAGGTLIDESLLAAGFFEQAKPAAAKGHEHMTGQITGSKLDIVFPPGEPVTQVRFGCSMAAAISVDLRHKGTPNPDLKLSDATCQTVDIPAGVHMIVVHVTSPPADGTPVSYAY